MVRASHWRSEGCVRVPLGNSDIFVSKNSSKNIIIGFLFIFCFLSDEGPTLETLNYTIRIGSTTTFLYFDLYLYSAYITCRALHNCPTPVTGISRFIEDFVTIYNIYRVWYLTYVVSVILELLVLRYVANFII